MGKRNTYFDVLRGIAIIFVIANHTANIAADSLTTLIIGRFIKIAVPLFIAISGFFISQKPINHISEYITFLSKQLPRVYIPLLIFSLPFIAGNGLIIRSIIGRTAISFLGAGLYPYYFVFLIAQYYILLPAYQRIARTKQGNVLNIIVSLISIAVVSYYNGYMSADLPIFIYAGLFPVFSMFFSQGCFLSSHVRDYSIKPLLIILPFALTTACIEDRFWQLYYTRCGLTVTTFLFAYIIIWILFSKKAEVTFNKLSQNKTMLFLANIGKISFTIFLLHAYIIQILNQYNLLTNSWCINTAIVFVITSLITYVMKLFLPQRVHRYFGL